jgi:hypothetical protein
MPEHHFSAVKPSLAFAKIVANPTSLAWSQVYNAGSLFVGLSLAQQETTEDNVLQVTGRSVFNSLEAEFFSLEEKNLKGITEAVIAVLAKVPEHITANLCLSYFNDSLLYVFIYGSGKISIKRGETVGTLLEKKEFSAELLSASGYLHNGDILLLQTEQFAKDVPEEIVQKALELSLPSDIAETLSPYVHQKEDGGSAAIIVSYHGATSPVSLQAPVPSEEEDHSIHTGEHLSDDVMDDAEEEEFEEEVTKRFSLPSFSSLLTFHFPLPAPLRKLQRMQLIIIGVVIVLLIVLGIGIFMTKKQQQASQASVLFQQIYPSAQKSYDEGKSLQKLNQELAHEDFVKAEKLLQDNVNKFPKGSPEERQVQALLAKVQVELGGGSTSSLPANKVAIKEVTLGENSLLQVEKSTGSEVVAVAEDASSIYTLSSSAVTSINKSTGSKKELIKNDKDWSSPQSIFPYQSNIYILDRTKGILKFVSGSGGFGKTTYFKDPAPDVSTAQAIAIDSSIYVLFKDGKISKYTRGTADSFSLSGMSKPFSSPTKIFTSVASDSIYILDPGNSRVVKIDKEGVFKTEYAADHLSSAKDFAIDEKNQKIYVLSEGKTWEIEM